ncbi:hypothetical protein H310_12888 [Aphanomyces invadans]|uniref:BZIP domain-containing protein n=1 Tax=Aphanomyces invadans TaxID=157072 RepID=A0A024TGC1_9STRA|nr:hypothetical protein H310_12888 [Aphanomyces invadans]ETV93093.1 hypothetical protein H310_12888 [Aphanomyces invadans]RHY24542.1 hypothetical protein DYB32_008807 [Aphanomyces invadans]|eukprot:XP_008878358.1 hypothetical protein H310_12888 [Aphanomyces invadans]
MATLSTPRLPMVAGTVHAMHMHHVVFKMEMAKRAAAANKVMLRQATRRNRSKLNQRRYRAQQKHTTDRLECTIETLRTEIARLEGRVDVMRLAVPPSLHTLDPECNLSKEYFRLFAHGYCVDPARSEHRTHVDFLTSITTDDLVFMGCVGRDKLFEQCMLYVTTFESYAIELHRLHVAAYAPNVVLHAESTLHLRISRDSIRFLVPRLLENEALVQKMVGRVLHLPLHRRFVFGSDLKVQELGTTADTTQALVNLLGNLEDTLTVLRDFQICEDAQLKPLPPPADTRNGN